MRKVMVMAATVLLAVGLVGCGGGSTETPAPTDVPVVDPSAESSASAETSDTVALGEVFYPFPVSDTTPASIRGGIDNGDPMILLFVDTDQKVTDDVKKQVNAVVKDNDIDLYTFNIGEYATVDADGTIQVDNEALKADPAGQALVATARELGITSVPFTVVVDYQGQVVFKQTGFIDAGLLERQVMRAVE